MPINIQQRSFLKLIDFSGKEIRNLLDLSRELKLAKLEGGESQILKGKNIVLISERLSDVYKCLFSVATADLGMSVTFLNPSDIILRKNESIKDFARVLGRMYNAIGYFGSSQDNIESLARFSGIPAWNGCSLEHSPIQVLADLITIQEHSDQPLRKISCCFIGDGRSSNVKSLIEAAIRIGFDLRIASPESLWPDSKYIENTIQISKETHGKITLTESVTDAVKNVDFIYASSWISMDDKPELWKSRIDMLKPFRVDMSVIELAKNPKVRFMHSLPAIHNKDSQIGQEFFKNYGLDGLEVTNDVFESPASVVFDQAENKLHALKAIMVATLG